ncbi:MAG: hypothetical protein ACR2FE_09875 [Aeromicrobium sp.]
MRRARRTLPAVGVAILALVVAVGVNDDEPRVDPYLQFVTAHLDVLPTQPEVVSSDARFSRSIAKLTLLADVEPALDACAGPVAVFLGEQHPMLVAEHDYCGGSAWIPKLERDDVVSLTGVGVGPGLYTTGEIKLVPREGSHVKDLPDADVVLQTCISRTKMVLVGLRAAPPDPAAEPA